MSLQAAAAARLLKIPDVAEMTGVPEGTLRSDCGHKAIGRHLLRCDDCSAAHVERLKRAAS